MELRYFFLILSKRKWLLLSVIIVAAVATAFIVGILPKKYKSSSVIETGLIDYKSVRAVGEANPFIQEFEIESKFANLTELMKGRPAINALTKKLILHDLQTLWIVMLCFKSKVVLKTLKMVHVVQVVRLSLIVQQATNALLVQ